MPQPEQLVEQVYDQFMNNRSSQELSGSAKLVALLMAR